MPELWNDWSEMRKAFADGKPVDALYGNSPSEFTLKYINSRYPLFFAGYAIGLGSFELFIHQGGLWPFVAVAIGTKLAAKEEDLMERERGGGVRVGLGTAAAELVADIWGAPMAIGKGLMRIPTAIGKFSEWSTLYEPSEDVSDQPAPIDTSSLVRGEAFQKRRIERATSLMNANRETANRVDSPLTQFSSDMHATLDYMLRHPDLLLHHQEDRIIFGFDRANGSRLYLTLDYARDFGGSGAHINTATFCVAPADRVDMFSDNPPSGQHLLFKTPYGEKVLNVFDLADVESLSSFHFSKKRLESVFVDGGDSNIGDKYFFGDGRIDVWRMRRKNPNKNNFEPVNQVDYALSGNGSLVRALSGGESGFSLEDEIMGLISILPKAKEQSEIETA